jgi:hypothetical protein
MALALLLLGAGCAALRPGPREALLAGRPDLIAPAGDSLEQAWWHCQRGDLRAAGRLAGGRLPESWLRPALDLAARRPGPEQDSLALLLLALSPEPAATVEALARQAGRAGRLLPDSLFARLDREPARQWRAARQAGSTSLLTMLIKNGAPGPRRGDFRILLARPLQPDAAFVGAWGRRLGLDRRDLEALARRGYWVPLAAWLEEQPPGGRRERRLQAEALAQTGRRERALQLFRELDDGRDAEIGQWVRLLEGRPDMDGDERNGRKP